MTETMDRAINRGSLIRTAGAAGAGLALGSGLFGATIARASGGVTKGDIDQWAATTASAAAAPSRLAEPPALASAMRGSAP